MNDDEAHEMIQRALDVAEKRLIDGSATPEEIIHLLRLGGVDET